MKEKLALFGGPKAVHEAIAPYNPIGAEEVEAARKVVESGSLSRFLGSWHPQFYGGEKVRAFEAAWAEHFGARHAVSVNSATSGLIAAVGAIGVEPGDEVIVSTWTMSASATAILVWNAIPVFADIETETFNLDPAAIERCITPQTKAIMVIDIHGHPARLDEIMAIARKHRLKVIEDCAQAPHARYGKRYAGTIADIGVFSLNFHKHIHTGEGGLCVTDEPELADRLQLIRNHAEAVVGDKGTADISNMIGFNFRMCEIEAAIGIEQLKKLPRLVEGRQEMAEAISARIKGLAGLRTPVVRPGCTHSFYKYALLLDTNQLGVSRTQILSALEAEGVPGLGSGYVNVHRYPLYQKKIAYGRNGFPWSADFYRGNVSYAVGICPNAEKLHDETFFGIEMCEHQFTPRQIELVATAFHKVWGNLDLLREQGRTPSAR
jgi:dTDP-4-amino-4,6-dideoxygalactose transaminase